MLYQDGKSLRFFTVPPKNIWPNMQRHGERRSHVRNLIPLDTSGGMASKNIMEPRLKLEGSPPDDVFKRLIDKHS